MALQSLDIKQRSATTTPAPEARQTMEIAKLIDVSACIGCKACQVACMEWNDLRDEVGSCVGVYDNPTDLTESSWTVMRFSEVEQDNKLEWLIRKDGCMHCSDPGCLKSCPAPGAIIQYANGVVDFHQENCIGCGYCVTGCPFNVPRISKKDNKAYKCTLCSDRLAVNQAPACVKAQTFFQSTAVKAVRNRDRVGKTVVFGSDMTSDIAMELKSNDVLKGVVDISGLLVGKQALGEALKAINGEKLTSPIVPANITLYKKSEDGAAWLETHKDGVP